MGKPHWHSQWHPARDKTFVELSSTAFLFIDNHHNAENVIVLEQFAMTLAELDDWRVHSGIYFTKDQLDKREVVG